jgi:ribosomal RNA-processing protein 9
VFNVFSHYNLNEMMYLETLYGHQFGVLDIDCHRKERPISVGRDRTARAWKLSEDSHLIFRGGAKVSNPDCVSVIKDDWFVTGHDDGHLGLWMTEKKRAVNMIERAHGSDGGVGRGICSVGTLKGSDLAITGSYDGSLRLWKARTGATLDTRGFEPLSEIPVEGYINGIAVGPKARFCVVAVGQEPALGRWNRIAKAKNRFGIIALRNDRDNDDDDEIDEAPPSAESESDDGDSGDDVSAAS